MAVTKVQLSNNNTDYTKQINDNFSELDTNKVSTEAGKGLSTNDYTNAEKTKLEGIEAGAQVNVIETVKVNGTALTPSSKAVDVLIPDYTIAVATTTEGYSKSYELQKDSVATGVKIDIPKDLVISSGSVEEVTEADEPYTGAVVGDKYVDLVLNNTPATHIYIPVNDLVDAYTAGNGINVSAGNEISVKVYATNANGLSVTANGLELAVATTSTAGAMSASDKTKLDGVATGAQVNVLEGLTINGTDGTITNKKIAITIPTKIFSKIKVGATEIEASSTTDTVELEAGTNISLSADATTKKITINATVPTGGTTISTLTFTSAQSGWGTIDANGNYTLTIANTGTPINVLKQSTDGGYEACMANIRADGTNFYVTADAKFDGMIMYY